MRSCRIHGESSWASRITVTIRVMPGSRFWFSERKEPHLAIVGEGSDGSLTVEVGRASVATGSRWS